MITVFAAEIGAWSLVMLYIWLMSAASAAWLSHRKGYGERPGLATGLLLPLIAIVVWLAWPPRTDSLWKKVGPFGRPKAEDLAAVGAAAGPRSPETPAPHAQDAATATSATASGDTRPESADVTERT